jgi:hypothetical protein
MPKARCAPSGWLRYLATAGDHAGDVTDGQHAPNTRWLWITNSSRSRDTDPPILVLPWRSARS